MIRHLKTGAPADTRAEADRKVREVVKATLVDSGAHGDAAMRLLID